MIFCELTILGTFDNPFYALKYNLIRVETLEKSIMNETLSYFFDQTGFFKIVKKIKKQKSQNTREIKYTRL